MCEKCEQQSLAGHLFDHLVGGGAPILEEHLAYRSLAKVSPADRSFASRPSRPATEQAGLLVQASYKFGVVAPAVLKH
jgi:hypothetical protein